MNNDKNSRMDKFEKRRKNTKLITYLLIFASALGVLLIGIWIFGETDEQSPTEIAQNDEGSYFLETEDEAEESIAEQEENSEDVEQTTPDNETEEAEENNGEELNEDTIEIEHLETDDDNVIAAYTADWPANGTTQTGPHTTDYADGSADRIEIKRAVSNVTDIREDDLIEVWIGNGGDQKVIATVTDSSLTENYRVYLEWIDEEGWKPTKVEVLRELDV